MFNYLRRWLQRHRIHPLRYSLRIHPCIKMGQDKSVIERRYNSNSSRRRWGPLILRGHAWSRARRVGVRFLRARVCAQAATVFLARRQAPAMVASGDSGCCKTDPLGQEPPSSSAAASVLIGSSSVGKWVDPRARFWSNLLWITSSEEFSKVSKPRSPSASVRTELSAASSVSLTSPRAASKKREVLPDY